MLLLRKIVPGPTGEVTKHGIVAFDVSPRLLSQLLKVWDSLRPSALVLTYKKLVCLQEVP